MTIELIGIRVWCAVLIVVCVCTRLAGAAETSSADGVDTYHRFMFETGSVDGGSLEDVLASYGEMKKAGCTALMCHHILREGPRLDSVTKRSGVSPEDYFKMVTGQLVTNGFLFWPNYEMPWDIYTQSKGVIEVEPLHRARLLEHFRETVERFKDYPCFGGIAYDEPGARRNYSSSFLDAFKEWLKARYAPKQLKDMGLAKLLVPGCSILAPPVTLKVDGKEAPALFGEYVLFTEEQLNSEQHAPVDERSFKKWLLGKHSQADIKKLGFEALFRSDTKLILPETKAVESVEEGGLSDSISCDIDMLLGDSVVGVTNTEASANESFPGIHDIVLPDKYDDNPVLYMEYEEFLGSQLESLYAARERELAEIRPGAITFPILSFGIIIDSPFRASVARLGRICGAISVDPYWDGAQEEGFWAKLMRSQAGGPSFLTISAGKYGTGPDRFARDLAMCTVHSPAVMIWCWPYAWKDEPLDPGTRACYQKGNYDVMTRAFARVDKVQQYLVPSESTAKIALVYSERESMWDQNGRPAWPRRGGFLANCYGLHCAFSQLGVQYEPIFEQFICGEELKPYTVVIVPAVTYLAPKTLLSLEEWVRKDGKLILMGPTGAKDRWGRPMSVSTVEPLCGATSRPVQGGVSSFSGSDCLKDRIVEYNKSLSATEYELSKAECIGKWNNGSIAATVNNIGKGKVYCLGTDRLGCCYVEKKPGRRFPILREFTPGVLEFLRDMLDMALGEERANLPLQDMHLSADTEVTIRGQKNRFVIHLIDFVSDYGSGQKQSLKIRIPPSASVSRVFYPEDNAEVQHRIEGRDTIIQVRDFDVNETIVVEYQFESLLRGRR